MDYDTSFLNFDVKSAEIELPEDYISATVEFEICFSCQEGKVFFKVLDNRILSIVPKLGSLEGGAIINTGKEKIFFCEECSENFIIKCSQCEMHSACFDGLYHPNNCSCNNINKEIVVK